VYVSEKTVLGRPAASSDARGRRFVHPEPGETLEELAARVLGYEPGELPPERYDEFLSWNWHLANRRYRELAVDPPPILPSEFVYVEPPHGS